MTTRLDRIACVMMGRTAAGKTTTAQFLSEKLGLEYLSSSDAREGLEKEFTAESCRDEEFRDQSYSVIIDAAARNLGKGVSLVLDASFHRRSRRGKLYEAVKDKAKVIIVIYCCCNDEAETARRIRERQQNPGPVHNRACSMDVYWHIDAGFEEPETGEFPRGVLAALIYLDTSADETSAKTRIKEGRPSTRSYKEAVSTILGALKQLRRT